MESDGINPNVNQDVLSYKWKPRNYIYLGSLLLFCFAVFALTKIIT